MRAGRGAIIVNAINNMIIIFIIIVVVVVITWNWVDWLRMGIIEEFL